ncbi:unnamed protein product [Spirodela intermedia]|uniref:Uncharacterized protein n=2 Tax=Spirodela intermedia TaxID=51605 RepID=A0A7I8J7S5_SPIIN|nr:unnamed protein product [Spirodela intermedia]CAA6665463.1 unnamed protein product [Spirodela intermedia]CAA7402201.1 unnamed protein product [Spirodela intermedia]
MTADHVDAPVKNTQNEIGSSLNHPFFFRQNPCPLQPLNMGAVQGHRKVGVEPLVGTGRRWRRIPSPSKPSAEAAEAKRERGKDENGDGGVPDILHTGVIRRIGAWRPFGAAFRPFSLEFELQSMRSQKRKLRERGIETGKTTIVG